MTDNLVDKGTVFVVDDEEEVRKSLKYLITSIGYEVKTYENGVKYFEESPHKLIRPSCIIVDARMPLMGGLELHNELKKNHSNIPIIHVTAHATVSLAVELMASGALYLFEKPINTQVLIDKLNLALRLDRESLLKENKRSLFLEKYNNLANREKEILQLIVKGLTINEMAHKLQVERGAIDNPRRKMLEKMCIKRVSDLVRQVLTLDLENYLCKNHLCDNI